MPAMPMIRTQICPLGSHTRAGCTVCDLWGENNDLWYDIYERLLLNVPISKIEAYCDAAGISISRHALDNHKKKHHSPAVDEAAALITISHAMGLQSDSITPIQAAEVMLHSLISRLYKLSEELTPALLLSPLGVQIMRECRGIASDIMSAAGKKTDREIKEQQLIITKMKAAQSTDRLKELGVEVLEKALKNAPDVLARVRAAILGGENG